MHVGYESCADCCIDWQPVAPIALDRERRGSRTPLDNTYSLVLLTRDEVCDFVEAGLGSTLFPRLWEAPPGEGIKIDGVKIVTIDGKPAFFVGIREPPKPITSFGLEWAWFRACASLDPETPQCRIHDTEFYPDGCAEYPEHNLVLEQETECERVERYHSGERLLDDAASDDLHDLLPGPHALGAKLFVHPESERLAGVIDHLKRRGLTPRGRTEFTGVTARSHPNSTEVDGDRASRARAKTPESRSWVGEAIVVQDVVAGYFGSAAGDTPGPDEVEVVHSTPEASSWDTVRDDD